MKPFTSLLAFTAVEKLCSVADALNQADYQAYQNEAYGDCIRAIEQILTEQFGADVCRLAMDSQTWCISSFDGQVLPAIESAIDETKTESIASNTDLAFCDSLMNAIDELDNEPEPTILDNMTDSMERLAVAIPRESALIEIGGSTLDVNYPADTDTETRFQAVCNDTGETLSINGWLIESIDTY